MMEANHRADWPGRLSENHREYLHKCCLTDEVIDGRPYHTLDDELRELLLARWKFHPAQLEPEGLVICRYDVATGEPTFPQVRYDRPRPDADGGLQKYCSPGGSGGVVDAHPLVRDRVLKGRETLWHAESVKGGDAVVSNGGVAVAYFGVGGWSKGQAAAPALDRVPLRSRRNVVAFDSDVRDPDKRGPILQLGRFCHYLAHARGAEVYVARLPFSASGEKMGLDDVLPEVG